MRFGAALAPRPDLANASTAPFAKSFGAIFTLWAREEGMSPEEANRYLFALSLADVYAVISRRHPEKMENCLRSLKAIGERVGVNVDAIRPDRRERVTRGSARRAAPQQGELDGDAQGEPQAVAPARRRRAAAHRRRRSRARPRRCLRCSSAHAGTGGPRGWMERVKSRLCRVVSCAVAFKNLMADALFYFSLLRFTLSAFGVEIPNYSEAFM